MKYFSDEKQKQPEELSHYSEFVRSQEQLPVAETPSLIAEQFASYEHPRPQPDEEKRRRHALERHRAQAKTAALFVTAIAGSGVIVAGISALPSSPAFSVKDELVGIATYESVVEIRNAGGKNWQVELAQQGEVWDSIPLAGSQSIALSFEDLVPDTVYDITVKDEAGKEYFTHSFETEAFVLFGEQEGNRIPFTLHESLGGADVSLDLYTLDGREFSSNILFDPQNVNYLYTDGLFADEYFFSATCHTEGDAEPLIYDKYMQMGVGVPPALTASATDGTLRLSLVEGELAPYDVFEWELLRDERYVRIPSDQIVYENGSLTAPLPAEVSAGEYWVSLWGVMETEDRTRYNELWAGGLTVEAPTVSLTAETVTLTSYGASLTIDNPSGVPLFAILKDGDETVGQSEISYATDSPTVSFGLLPPETAFTMAVVDESGNEWYAGAFSTPAFVTVGEPTDGQIPFTLHESLAGTDVGLRLIDSRGLDFSANIMFDPEATNYVYTNGLFADTYILEATCYFEPDVPTVLEKEITLGSGVAPDFVATAANGELTLTLTAGDVAPYVSFEVELEQNGVYRTISYEMIGYENGVLTATLPAEITGGTYRITLWGFTGDPSSTMSNEIWKGEITVTV